jgi:hypothetical protein
MKSTYLPDDIFNTIKEFMWSPLINKFPGILCYPDYHPLIHEPHSRRSIENVKLAQRSMARSVKLGHPKRYLMSYLLCNGCLKLKQDYNLECCDECLPKHKYLEITVTYKFTGSSSRNLEDVKKIPIYHEHAVYNIKHLMRFHVPKDELWKPIKYISSYHLDTLPNY